MRSASEIPVRTWMERNAKPEGDCAQEPGEQDGVKQRTGQAAKANPLLWVYEVVAELRDLSTNFYSVDLEAPGLDDV